MHTDKAGKHTPNASRPANHKPLHCVGKHLRSTSHQIHTCVCFVLVVRHRASPSRHGSVSDTRFLGAGSVHGSRSYVRSYERSYQLVVDFAVSQLRTYVHSYAVTTYVRSYVRTYLRTYVRTYVGGCSWGLCFVREVFEDVRGMPVARGRVLSQGFAVALGRSRGAGRPRVVREMLGAAV